MISNKQELAGVTVIRCALQLWLVYFKLSYAKTSVVAYQTLKLEFLWTFRILYKN
jgi:hypothetical protein